LIRAPARHHHRGREGAGVRDDQDARRLRHQIGEQGTALSAGQRSAWRWRGLYGNPFLIVLDEPNSNLDTEGDEALTRAVRAARERGAIVVVVAHRPIGSRPSISYWCWTAACKRSGPKETVLGQVLQRVAPPSPIKIVSDGGAKS
jgi:ATP-binding cassette subfamily C protein